MNDLLEKEKILFDSVMNKRTDKDTVSAFYDYATFVSTEGMPLLAHKHESILEYNKETKEIEDLYNEIIEVLKKDTPLLEKVVRKIGLEKDEMILDRFKNVKNFLINDYKPSASTVFDTVRLEYMDILRKLYDLGYNKEISNHTIISSSYNPFVENAVVFKDREKYYSLLKAFRRKHSRTVVGAVVNVITILANMNKSESTVTYKRDALIGDVEKIHNSIILEKININSNDDTKGDQIFFIKGEDIHHYELGPLMYTKRHGKDPKYIEMLKSIIRYMPKERKEMRVVEFEKLLPKNRRFKEKGKEIYKSNLGSAGKAFHEFLKKNKFHNTHPSSKKPIIKVTEFNIDFRNNL